MIFRDTCYISDLLCFLAVPQWRYVCVKLQPSHFFLQLQRRFYWSILRNRSEKLTDGFYKNRGGGRWIFWNETLETYKNRQFGRSSAKSCDKKDKLKLSSNTFNSNSSLRAYLQNALCGNVAANVRDISPPQSPLCGRAEAWGEGKMVHHTFTIYCLIIAFFVLEYPSAGASAEEMRETTCKVQTNCLSNSNSMPDLNREIFSHHLIAALPRTWSF